MAEHMRQGKPIDEWLLEQVLELQSRVADLSNAVHCRAAEVDQLVDVANEMLARIGRLSTEQRTARDWHEQGLAELKELARTNAVTVRRLVNGRDVGEVRTVVRDAEGRVDAVLVTKTADD